jgi:type I restriction enzyme R subunit
MMKLHQAGEDLGLTQEELAFYDALTKPQAIKDFYENETLVEMTRELTEMLRKNRTIDWQKKETARATMRKMVKRLLKKYKYPPDEAKGALETVMRQCELWVDETEYEDKAETALPHPTVMWQGRQRLDEDPYEYAEAAARGDSRENADDGYKTV